MSDTTLFDSLDDYLEIPRLTGLVLAPDGSRLVAPVQSLSADRKGYVTSLWQIDTEGGASRRLTRSAPGESAPAFLPDGDVLFVSKRPDPSPPPGSADDTKDTPSLWRLPAAGGEAELLVSRSGGVSRVFVAREAGTVVVSGPTLPGDAGEDQERRRARREAGVTAILHEELPVRHWDHDLGPGHARLFVAGGPGDWELRDLTPDPGSALEEVGTVVSADGATVFTGWRLSHAGGRESQRLVAIDVASGERRVVVATDEQPDGQHDYDQPAVAPDGRWVAFLDDRAATRDVAPTTTLAIVDLATGEQRDLLAGFRLWPSSPVASADSSAVFFVADEAGHAPVFRVDVESGTVTRLTASGAYSALCPSSDGTRLYALRSHVDSPARPVRLDGRAADQEPVVLDAPGAVGRLPGRVEEVEATGADGARIRGWLVLPGGEAPAPLLLWVHGGPLMSWNAWSWRWNPWLMAAQGWAVLLPDPGLSQGYGDEFVQRAWGQWGAVPFGDLMAITDAVCGRDDVDDSRTAAMGGSYGGYMANWIAGHTDRFGAIVTHASLWALDRFVAVTDHPSYWVAEWGYPDEDPKLYEGNSPHLHAGAITTPMLVIHGDKDYRVPVGEGLSLWTELVRRGVDAKLLYFPDEGHWVLEPAHAKLWYQTVSAFLDHHVRGAEWERPALL